MTDRFEHHARTVTLLTLLSRFTGLARDATLSRIFGAGLVMDAFFFAFMVPNLFRRLFGEGALSAAFLPVYSKLQSNDPAIAKQLASMTVAMLTVALGGVVLAAEAGLYVASQIQGHSNLAIWLTMIMLPYMPMVCAVAIFGAMLQVHGRFGPTAAAPIVLNLMIVTAALLGAQPWSPTPSSDLAHIGLVAGAVIAAGVVQVLWSLWALRGRAWWETHWRSAWPAMRKVFAQAGPMVVGLGVLQLNALFDGLIASYPSVIGSTVFGFPYPLEEGAMATVSFAQRLYQFPLGVFGIAVATAIFPLLARLSDDDEGFTSALRQGLRLVVYIGLPASVGLMVVRQPLVTVILQGGDFTSEDAGRAATVLLGYAPAVWAYSMIHVLTRAYYARGNSRTPMKIAVGVVALNFILNCTLIWFLREAGLAWSTSICAVVQVALLLSILQRRELVAAPDMDSLALQPVSVSPPSIINRTVLRSWARSLGLSGIMAAALLLMRQYVEPGDAWIDAFLWLLCFVAAGASIILLGSRLLRMPELAWAMGRGSDAEKGSREE